jgi:ATP-binding cassette subfamily B protein
LKEILRIIRYSWSLKRYYIWTSILVIIVSVLNQTTPFFLKFIVDGIVSLSKGNHVSTSYFIWLLVLILVVSLLTTIISNIQGYIGDRLAAKLNTLLATKYYDHILTLPLEYYDNEVAGRITNRLDRSITTISGLMNAFANNFVGFFLTAAITLGILAYYAWPVAILLGALFPFYIWLTTLSSSSWLRRMQPINQTTDIAQGRFVESIAQIRAVKSFVQEHTESLFFKSKRNSIEDQVKDQSIEWHWYDIARRLGLNIIFFGIYAYIVLQTVKGRYTLGDLTLLLQLVTQAQFPLFASSFIVDNIQRASSGSKDFFDVIATRPTVEDSASAGTLSVKSGLVEFKDVSFAYAESHRVLDDISFTIRPGSKLALVGESGEGKTTIANLLCRFYDVSGGTILIDGTNITSVTQSSLRQSIGVVFQEPALFSGTIKDNLTYGSPDANEAKVHAAAEAANAADFIARLPKGYDTEIGERGVKLSGGQKQRLAIARAILKNAPILILDEATSSLDSKAEHEVQTALKHLMKGRTTLIIAHRLSTIASVDWIISLKSGRAVEAGTPADLAKSGGIYAELLALQNPTEANRKQLEKYDIQPTTSL